MKKKVFLNKFNFQITKDFILNILSSIILVFVTQIIIYPFLSKEMSSVAYGSILTIIGAVNAIGGAFGNALDNTRILLNSSYEKVKLSGDFNLIFVVISIFDTIIIYFFANVILDFNIIHSIEITIISLLVLFRSYYTVGFRIKTQFSKYVITSIFAFIGYLFGLYITIYTNDWIYSFIFGELFACIYILRSSEIIFEPFIITNLFSKTIKKYLLILGASIISSLMTYMDRFFIFPILGFEQVAIFNVATFLGKTLGIIINPISGVLLTYYSKETSLSISKFYKRLSILVSITITSYFLIILFGYYVIDILYPTYSQSVVKIFYVANASIVIFILGGTLQPTLLKFCSSKWQPIIQISYLITYIFFGLIGLKYFGLIGFCYSMLMTNILRFLFMVSIVHNTLRENAKHTLL